jgi:hypothetical protein
MKRRIIAVALVVIASPALALDIALPFEQAQLDRQLPEIQFAPVAPYTADSRAPYEQVVVDRALPNLPARNRQLAGPARGLGDTRSDAGPDADMPAESPWANDFHFIAPPQ